MSGTERSAMQRVIESLPDGANVVCLTGAGISAESGIPTFRGKEGYWRVGSRNYQPEELATHAAFVRMPGEIWSWYLYRRGRCWAAEPNEAHQALARLADRLGPRLVLVTQNVDGLHRRAGNPPELTYEIHGNIDAMRCAQACSTTCWPIPAAVSIDWARGRTLGHAEWKLLRCPACGAPSRPHVLWFDECYDEQLFRFESSIAAVKHCQLLVVIGTSGSTNLPLQMGALAMRLGTPTLVINVDANPFSAALGADALGVFLRGQASRWVPEVVTALVS